MPFQLPKAQNILSEPKHYKPATLNNDYELNSLKIQQDRAWLREQLLAGKNSPLCEPITPAFFERLRARVRGEV